MKKNRLSRPKLAAAAVVSMATAALVAPMPSWATADASASVESVVQLAQETASLGGQGGFVVYFPLDSDILDEGAEAVIDEVAAKATEQGARSITVYGHTDRNGSLRHNTWLSQRRANQVKDALVLRGLSPESIQIVTVADKELAVDQAPGSVEQANRRAVIVFE